MYYGHTQRVEANQTQYSPVEGLRLDQVTDGEANPFLFSSQVGRALILALHTAPCKRGPWGASWQENTKQQ